MKNQTITFRCLPSSEPFIHYSNDLLFLQVTGPNNDQRFHINSSSEILYQISGDACIEMIVDGEMTQIVINEGEGFVIPPNIPHHPIRELGSVGIVVEQIGVDKKSTYIYEKDIKELNEYGRLR